MLAHCIGPPLPAVAGDEPWADAYLAPGELSAAYGTAADAVDVVSAGELLLELVNGERLGSGLGGLTWGDLAARAAQAYADEMVGTRMPGHCDSLGRKCEQRFNRLGGTDHVSENFAYYEIEHSVYLTPQLIGRIHQHWLASPGHRALILGPEHTHMGCGFALLREGERTFVAAVCLFVNDYGDYEMLAETAKPGDTLSIRGRLDHLRASLRYVGIAVEHRPPRGAVGSLRTPWATYSQPPVLLALVPRRRQGVYQSPAPYQQYVVDYDPGTGEFAVDLRLLAHAPAGAYYVTVWVELAGQEAGGPAEAAEPLCAMTQVLVVE